MKKREAIQVIEEAIRLLSHRLSQTEKQISELRKIVSQMQMSNAAVDEIAKKFRVYGK